jgi:hypothetical protein
MFFALKGLPRHQRQSHSRFSTFSSTNHPVRGYSQRFLLTRNSAKHPMPISLRTFDQKRSLCHRCCCYRRL